ncbi:MAG: hypothetical protein A2934_00260 [Candidatus Sungbacteria bacterium RIFCSPLOWO2_01_FULL_47_10]|uniref:AMP-dependent synthetase/ligase domain-containing protein n=1 Tax=Candidatus Sungbacteria bacterium RIFCSPLOWO2_01_FULL_47_10 TaxID=1802276 RepID=A0A1G2LAM2_9BACT|nr:MAG: hypothetical protein A2934_00260 [Candidatus Sungbacteria bacterium RIFCSPLOWO2_01_FULL_47_10]
MKNLQKINYFSSPLAWDQKLGKILSRHYARQWSSFTEYLSPDATKDMRDLRMNRLILRTYKNVPAYSVHYREAHIDPAQVRCEADLRLLPCIAKSDFKKYAMNNISCFASDIPKTHAYANSTSGSTGEPFQYALDMRYANEKTVLRYRYWNRAGITMSEPKIFCAPKSALFLVPNLIFLHPHFFRARKKEYIERIRTSKAEVLFGFPLLVFDLLWALAEENIDLTFRRAVLAGHSVSPGIRSFLKKRFECEMFEYYGTGETGSIAAECEIHNGLHIQEENSIVEVIDDQGKPVPDGISGKILITSLSNEIMPFIRYDPGDKGMILPDRCPCGRTSKRIVVEGRNNEFLMLGKNGEIISPSILRGVLDQYFNHFHRYQMVQETIDHFVLNIVPVVRLDKSEERKLLEKLYECMGQTANVSIQYVKKISPLRGGKFQYFVSNMWSRKFPDGFFSNIPIEQQSLALQRRRGR